MSLNVQHYIGASRGYQHTKCVVCFKPITQSRTGRPRRTCSNLCRQHYFRVSKRIFDRDREPDKKARAAKSLLRRVERYSGRADETRLYVNPRMTATKRDLLLVRMGLGEPLELCQWCAKPMVRPHSGAGKLRQCCSRSCRIKFGAFLARLEDGLITHAGNFNPAVMIYLRDFKVGSKDPQFVLRHEVSVCRHCGKPYPVYSITRKYCSKPCRQAAWYRRHHRLVRHWRRCLGCFKKFRARFGHQTTCGPACRQRFELAGNWYVDDVQPRHCAGCGELFLSRNPKKQYCQQSCRMRHNSRMVYSKKAKTQPRERCAWCGETLPPRKPHTGGSNRQTCSRRCWGMLWRMRRKQPIPLPSELLVPATQP